MRFKNLLILGLVILGILSLVYAYGPRWGGYYNTNPPEIFKISGTVEKIYYAPALTISVKTASGENFIVKVGPVWLQDQINFKVGSKVEVEGYKSYIYNTNVIRALKLTVDGKKVFDISTDINYGFGKWGYMRCHF
ncbi:MAG: hypothetical protein ACPLKX_01590 [Dictyoglomaceae bacterium]